MTELKWTELKWKESGVDIANLILAALLFLTPWIFGFAHDYPAAPSAWVSGIIIGVVAIAALTKFAEWEEWVNLVLGVWVLVSPWVLGFAAQSAAGWAHVIAGLIVAVLAGVKLWFMHQTPQVTARR
ncbi:SPW repeat protein [Bradyrhizobium sp. ISRA442]|uniref:SPW repeat protein n=1 Tax=Bradyrhizobium sp. ISRA442 TaxID=2866197 RepID=UPI00311ADEF1